MKRLICGLFQCFSEVLNYELLYGFIDSGACCSVIEKQGLVCDPYLVGSNSKLLVCRPVKDKLRRSLKTFMRKIDILYNGVRCCVNAVNCSGKTGKYSGRTSA